ncbi:MAG: DoxX family protein [Phycisphaeraceae bacterium]
MAKAAHEAWFHLTSLLARVALGLYFLLAGVGKVRGELQNGIGSFYESSFQDLQPDWLPTFFAAPYGYALPWAEVVIGATLVLGLATRISATLIALMLLSFTIALMIANGISGGGPGPFHANIVMLTLALMLITLGGGAISVDAAFRGKKATP